MHLHRVALILVIAAIACQVSWADTQCKTAVMDIHMKNCARAKRSPENVDIQMSDEKTKQITKRDGFDSMDPTMMDTTSMDSSTMIDSESHGQPQKRHLFRSRHYNPYGYLYGNGFPYGSLYGSQYGSQYGYGSLYGSPYGSSYGYGYPFRSYYRRFGPRIYNPLAFNEDFDIDLSEEELDELYDKIYERQPRASKDEAWKVFLETASKCCKNIEKCLREKTHVPCLTG